MKNNETISVKSEIKDTIILNRSDAEQRLFNNLFLPNSTHRNIMSSLVAGHHLLIIGPPGSGKTSIAMNVANLLSPRKGVKDCPLHCYENDQGCPWCNYMKKKELADIKASERVVRIQGSSEITPEDIIGDLDPDAAILYGMRSTRAFVPGKALRANHGVLILDFIDKMPERPMNALIQTMEGDTVFTSHFDEKIPLDVLMIGTGGPEALDILPGNLIDNFDIIITDYIEDAEKEKKAITAKAVLREEVEMSGFLDDAAKILAKTRTHDEIKRGVSTRGGIKYVELANAYPRMNQRDSITKQDIKDAAVSALPHRLQLHDYVATVKKPDDLLMEIVDEVIGDGRQEVPLFSKDSLMALAKEIATRSDLKRPLKYGFYDILLKRIQKNPDSELSQLHQGIYDKAYDIAEKEELTEELLERVEEARKLKERMVLRKKELEMEALNKTLDTLADIGMLEKNENGYLMGQKGITCLLEMLFPNVVGKVRFYGYGKHVIGKKSPFGTGRIVGTRKYHLGDSYKNVSFKDTLREAIRNRRKKITREDIRVNKKDIRSKLYIVLAIDLSGTMAELDKLWYAKETSGAVALSSLGYKDKVGVVSFSNLADNVVEITDNPYELMSAVLDLNLHENAFTNIGYGIRKAKEMLLRYRKSSAARHIIMISDGDATAPDPSPDKFAIREAMKTARKGITISTVCINQLSANPKLLQKIARIGRGRMYTIDKTEELTSTVLEDVNQTRNLI